MMELRLAACASVLLALAGSASAQWTVTNLHPAGATASEAYDIRGGQQIGIAVVGGKRHASLWTGAADSWIDLHPESSSSEFDESVAFGISDDHQVGYIINSLSPTGDSRAGFWSGSASSWSSLDPSGLGSRAYGGHLDMQAGWRGSPMKATLWFGDEALSTSLHPLSKTSSIILGVDETQQVGWTRAGSSDNAALWTGTAESYVNLHPSGVSGSYARRVDQGQQVGYAIMSGNQRAALWSGTAASWVNLNPPGSTGSYAIGVFDGRQVGFATFGGVEKAGMWQGTAASWEDLSVHLVGSWGASRAYGVWHDHTTLYVVGHGFNNDTGRVEALLWSRPFCPADYNRAGDEGDVIDFLDFLNDFGTCVGEPLPCGDLGDPDVNGDTIVDVLDFLDFLDAFGTGC